MDNHEAKSGGKTRERKNERYAQVTRRMEQEELERHSTKKENTGKKKRTKKRNKIIRKKQPDQG